MTDVVFVAVLLSSGRLCTDAEAGDAGTPAGSRPYIPSFFIFGYYCFGEALLKGVVDK